MAVAVGGGRGRKRENEENGQKPSKTLLGLCHKPDLCVITGDLKFKEAQECISIYYYTPTQWLVALRVGVLASCLAGRGDGERRARLAMILHTFRPKISIWRIIRRGRHHKDDFIAQCQRASEQRKHSSAVDT